jgi:hypothetical protein
LENPQYLSILRGCYLFSQLAIILLSFYLISIIRKKNGKLTKRNKCTGINGIFR